jgi:hypothetical protein
MKKNNSRNVRKWRRRTKEKIVKAMGGKCQCCGYDFCIDAFSLHHLNSNTKETTIANLLASHRKWEAIVEELRKCILVCHNCHAEIHAGSRKIPEKFEKFNEEHAIGKFDANHEKYDNCPICFARKPIKNRYCSRKCFRKSREKLDWSNIDLENLLKKHGIVQLSKILQVSDNTIYKHLKKRKNEQKEDFEKIT